MSVLGLCRVLLGGWGLLLPQLAFYLAPTVVVWILGLVAVTWPRVGGRSLIVIVACWGRG